MTVKVCDYKDFAIHVSEFGTFSAEGIESACDTMEKMKAIIDRVSAIKYIPVDGLLITRRGMKYAIESVKVTRPHNRSYGAPSYWIIDQDKRRSASDTVFIDSPKNRDIASKILKKHAELQQIAAELKALEESIDRNFNLQPQNKDATK